ncbi:choice-of-anchor P family protein [Nocardioides sp. YIM 152315]|uniref:choice-of-anchor P family protein n=1 Tax=Nocardioides sp. YIM 152315 TaxID=3031760 RepID=UPI0023DB3C31|nr:choice-of-anchor P family protein [Nocardioides sp. YIM 152315]MDF1603240.1 choice-of-anchor P family protein [Nocardioides sp. YIM 152315]
MPRPRPRAALTAAVAATFGLVAPMALAGPADAGRPAQESPAQDGRSAAPGSDRSTDVSATERRRGRTPTEFALRSSGFATDVKGGQIPAAAGATALAVIGCTNKAGIDRSNDLASVEIPGLGTVSATKTRTWTSQTGDEVAVTTRHSVGEVVLSDSPLGTLSLSAITTTAKASHDASGFHAYTNTDLGGLTFTPPEGQPQELKLPVPGQPITIPNVATISLGSTWTREKKDKARAYANGLLVHLIPTDTRVRVAHAGTEIFSGIRKGVFAGSAYGVSGSLGGDLVSLGRNPVQRVPCQGTGGEVRKSSLAGIDLAGQVKIGAMTSEGMGTQTDGTWGFARAKVADIDLGGALKIEGIVAQATVERKGRKIKRSWDGSSLGAVTVNGERMTFPDTGPLEIPGVAKLEPLVVERLKTGMKVVGLRVSLLDGTGAVLDLATARLRIGRSGN